MGRDHQVVADLSRELDCVGHRRAQEGWRLLGGGTLNVAAAQRSEVTAGNTDANIFLLSVSDARGKIQVESCVC